MTHNLDTQALEWRLQTLRTRAERLKGRRHELAEQCKQVDPTSLKVFLLYAELGEMDQELERYRSEYRKTRAELRQAKADAAKHTEG